MLRLFMSAILFMGVAQATPLTNSSETSGLERLEQRLELLQKSNVKLSEQFDEQFSLIKKILNGIESVAENSNKISNKLNEKMPIELCEQATSSGVYTLQNDNLPGASKEVFCDMKTLGGGWTVIQQRLDGSVNFNRSWAEYRDGFGTVGKSSEFWLGLEAIHQLTSQLQPYELMVEVKNEHGKYGHARYGRFKIAGEGEGYQLSAVHDVKQEGLIGDSLSILKGEKFSTYDRDNDLVVHVNCAQKYSGGWWWWFIRCDMSCLNGPFIKDNSTKRGIFWGDWTNAATFSRMMIRPNNKR